MSAIRSEVIAELDEIATYEIGWDGYNGAAASPETQAAARVFLALIPEWVPDPEACLMPEGEISFDWYPTGAGDKVLIINLDDKKLCLFIHQEGNMQPTTTCENTPEERARIIGLLETFHREQTP